MSPQAQAATALLVGAERPRYGVEARLGEVLEEGVHGRGPVARPAPHGVGHADNVPGVAAVQDLLLRTSVVYE